MRAAGLSGMVAAGAAARRSACPASASARTSSTARSPPTAPNRLWVADITDLRTWEGWLYLVAVLDLFSRRIVGWAMADHMRAELVVDALQMALWHRRPDAGTGPALRSGAASTCRWPSARPRAPPASRSRWAAAATARQRRLRELLRHAQEGAHPPPLLADTGRARTEVFEYIEVFYNRRRRHSTLGYRSPADYENRTLSHARCRSRRFAARIPLKDKIHNTNSDVLA